MKQLVVLAVVLSASVSQAFTFKCVSKSDLPSDEVYKIAAYSGLNGEIHMTGIPGQLSDQAESGKTENGPTLETGVPGGLRGSATIYRVELPFGFSESKSFNAKLVISKRATIMGEETVIDALLLNCKGAGQVMSLK